MFITDLTYESLDGDDVTKTFHFHLSKTEVLEVVLIAGMEGDLEAHLKALQGNNLDAYEFFKSLMSRSVGRRDGDQFIKDDTTRGAFMNTGAYSAMFDKLQDTNFAAAFVSGVVPKSIGTKAMADPRFRESMGLEGVKSEVRDGVRTITEVRPHAVSFDSHALPQMQGGLVVGEPIVDELLDAQLADEADVQAYLKTLEEPKKLEEYTRKELLELPKDDWDALVGTDPRKWSKAVMSIAMLRRSKTK